MTLQNLTVVLSFLFCLNTSPAWARMDGQEERAPAKLTPAQILSGIYKPWTGPLRELEKNLRPDRNYVVWIHVPAQHPMDLRSAETFRRWALATPVTQLTISHNMIAFRCRNQRGQFVTGATGMTGASDLQDAKALLKGYGLSIFFSTYTDGHLNPVAEVDEYITKNLRKRGAIFSGFEVTEGQCANMQTFLADFVHHPRRPFERFNNVGDPEKFEGGGCVTFAAVLLKKAGLLDRVIPSLYRHFSAPRYLVGGNLERVEDVEAFPTPWLNGRRRSISLNQFWSDPWVGSPPSFPGEVKLSQIDPEKMVYSLKQMAHVYMEDLSEAESTRVSRKLAASPLGPRVSVTANNLENPPNLVFSRQLIDDRFDPEMADIGRRTREWLHGRLRGGQRIRLGEAVGMPVLLLEAR